MDNTVSGMVENTANYKRTLDRITEKYSKLSRLGAALDVNLEHTTMREIQRHMAKSQLELSRIEAESPASGWEYSFTDGNKTYNNSQIAYQAEETNESIGSNNSIMDGVSVMEQTQASGQSDDTRGNLTDVLMQPEDQDEDLERTLSSHGSSLMELYPQMISQIEKARHRQHVSQAAGSVLRRYRRMRRTNANARNTTDRKPTPRGDSQHHHHHHHHHHLGRSCDEHNPTTAVESSSAAFHSLARRHSNRPEPLQMWRAPPEREADRERRDEKRPVLVMDFYSPKPSQASMNQTFTVSKGSAPRSPLSGKPRRHSCSPAVQSPTQTRRFDRSNGPRVMESSTVHNSPVRLQRSFETKWRHQESYGGSPVAFARHSNTAYMEGYSREAKQARYNPSSPSLHEHSPLKSRRRLYHQDGPSPSRLGLGSPRLPSETGRPSFQRHRSFDSALRPGGVARSPATLEEEFTKLYHKFVCQGQSPLSDRFPCRCCAGRLEANRRSSWFSASSLSALALSPHRSVLQKRVRELDQDKSPMSKRPRELTSSPGSLRHCKERLRNMCFGSRVPLSSTRLDFPSWGTAGVQRPAGELRGEGRGSRFQPVFLDFQV